MRGVTETVTKVTEIVTDEDVSESVEVVIQPDMEIPSSSEEELEHEKPEYAVPEKVPEEERVIEMLSTRGSQRLDQC